jgi:hypothetical protein
MGELAYKIDEYQQSKLELSGWVVLDTDELHIKSPRGVGEAKGYPARLVLEEAEETARKAVAVLQNMSSEEIRESDYWLLKGADEDDMLDDYIQVVEALEDTLTVRQALNIIHTA